MRWIRVAVAATMLMPTACLAGAFNEPAGHGEAILTQSSSNAAQYVQSNGVDRLPVKFQWRERALLIQYGLTDHLMAIVKVSRDLATGVTGESYDGSGPTDLGLQVQLPSVAGFVLAAQGIRHIPSRLMRQGSWLFGQTGNETEIRLLAGRTTSTFGHRSFVDLQAGFRYRADGYSREWHFDVTHGVMLTSSSTLLLQSFTTRASGRSDNPYSLFEQNKRQVSIVHDFGPLSLQIGTFRTVSGRRIYMERGKLIAIWLKF
jgi:hypothetical protein